MARRRFKSFQDIYNQSNRLMLRAGRLTPRGQRIREISSRYMRNITNYAPATQQWMATLQIPRDVYMGLNNG